MIYTFGEFELDTHLFELRASGTRRPVEPQVFDVLRYLVEQQERVVPKEELLEKLWPERYVSETTLTSRLMAARKALGDDAKRQQWIQTVHGRGYRFRGDAARIELSGATLTSASVSGAFVIEAREVPARTVEVRAPAPFVGRAAELARLCEFFEAASSGRRQVVFVSGEAGSGKTTLVDAFLASLPQSTASRIAAGHCLENRGTGEAYLPWLEAVERLVRGASTPEILDTLRREAPSWLAQMPVFARVTDVPAEQTGERMLRELAVTLETITRDSPLVIVLEDLHWSDFSTLDLLTTVARRPEPARLMIIGTYRPADVKATKHPLYAVTQELLIRGHCRQIALPLLEAAELEQLIETRYPGAEFYRRVASLLHQRTAGNPLFAGAMLDAWAAQGHIRDDGGWTMTVDSEELARGVPTTLTTLIEQHIAALPADQQELLEAASVAGRAFSSAAIASAAQGDEAEIERCCASLAREGRFLHAAGTEIWSDGTIAERFSFTHDLYVDVLYGRIPAGRRARLHAAIGRRLEDAWSDNARDHAAELALHFARSHDHERTLAYEKLAAELALTRGARHEAREHLTSALAALQRLPDDANWKRDELSVRAALADSIVATRGWGEQEAEDNYLRARELARSLGDRQQLSNVLYGLATMYEFRGEYERTEETITERLEVEGDASPLIRLQSHELLLCSLMHQARFKESLTHAQEAFDAAMEICPRGEAPPVIAIQSHGWASAALMFAGRPDEALSKSCEVRELAGRAEDELGHAIGLAQASLIHLYRREADDAARHSEAAIDIATEIRFPFVVGVGRIVRGWSMAERGAPFEVALTEIRHGIRICKSLGANMDAPLFLAIAADVCLRAGFKDDAREAIEEALQIVEGSRSFFYRPEVSRLRGAVAESVESDREAAIGWYRRALALARQQGSTLLALRAARSLALAEASERHELETSLAQLTEGHDTLDAREARETLDGLAS